LPEYGKRDFDTEVKDFDQALKIAPKDDAAVNERAQVWIDKGHYLIAPY